MRQILLCISIMYLPSLIAASVAESVCGEWNGTDGNKYIITPTEWVKTLPNGLRMKRSFIVEKIDDTTTTVKDIHGQSITIDEACVWLKSSEWEYYCLKREGKTFLFFGPLRNRIAVFSALEPTSETLVLHLSKLDEDAGRELLKKYQERVKQEKQDPAKAVENIQSMSGLMASYVFSIKRQEETWRLAGPDNKEKEKRALERVRNKCEPSIAKYISRIATAAKDAGIPEKDALEIVNDTIESKRYANGMKPRGSTEGYIDSLKTSINFIKEDSTQSNNKESNKDQMPGQAKLGENALTPKVDSHNKINPEANRARSMLNIANQYLRIRDINKASEYANRIIAEFPGTPEADSAQTILQVKP